MFSKKFKILAASGLFLLFIFMSIHSSFNYNLGSQNKLQPMSQSITFNDAVDNQQLSFTYGGDNQWFIENDTSIYGGSAAESGDINDSQTSWFTTTVQGPYLLQFFWSVSSEDFCDFLNFYVDGVQQNSISGDVSWQEQEYNLTSGSHTLEWEYSKDGSVSLGNDSGYVDYIQLLPANQISYNTAVDNQQFLFTSGGDNQWFTEDSNYTYGGSAVESGDITDSQTSWFNTTIQGPVDLQFYWAVSSELDCDFLVFYIDGVQQNEISGNVNWQLQDYSLSTGSHTLKWEYSKDGSNSVGNDSGYVDYIQFTTIIDFNSAVDNQQLSFTFGGDNQWSAEDFMYYIGDSAVESGAISDSQSSWFSTTVTGPGDLQFYWSVSSEDYLDNLTFYIDGVQQNIISGYVYWEVQSYSLSTGSHTLTWEYSKNSVNSYGDDCGYIDDIKWVSTNQVDFNTAVDNQQLSFTFGGGNQWFGETSNYNYNGSAVESGLITDSQTSSFSTTIQGPGELQFYWSVSSEEDFDYLIFYIDGIQQNSISGEVSWQEQDYLLSMGSHTLMWEYSKDGSDSYGSDCGYVDYIQWNSTTQIDFNTAVDNQQLSFTFGGDSPWFGETSNYDYNGSAVESGLITDSQTSSFSSTVQGPGDLQFYWAVSSEQNFDYLAFYIDGVQQNSISGDVTWQEQDYSLSTGSHILTWEYSKDMSDSVGSDCGWVDLIQWNSTSVPSVPLNPQYDNESNQVIISWQSPQDSGSSPITGYRIYRAMSSGDEYLIAQVGNVHNFTDTNVKSGLTYSYQISAMNAAGEGPKTSLYTVTIPSQSLFAIAGYNTVVVVLTLIGICSIIVITKRNHFKF